jgi:hypothetical protein
MDIILFIVALVFTLTNMADGVTFLFIRAGEANPLFLLLGNTTLSVIVLLTAKVLLTIGMWWMFVKYKQIPNRALGKYSLILVALMGTFAFCLGVYTNVRGIMNPEIVEYAASLPVEEKIKGYASLVVPIYLIPVILSLLSFKIWQTTSEIK